MWWTRKDVRDDASFMTRLIAGEMLSDSVAVIVAHPDDETIGMGGRLPSLGALTLVHMTDGAPRDMDRLKKKGFDDAQSYSSARFRELDAAIGILGAHPLQRLRYDYPDGELVFRLVESVERVQTQLRDKHVVITHAYEGGHPDHDACALVTQYATHKLAKSGFNSPVRIEFASYFSLHGRVRVGDFWPDENNAGRVAHLTRDERRRKLEAMKAFKTQEWITKVFGVRREMYRIAPTYNFRVPPPPAFWLYDGYGWPITGQSWLRHATIALDALIASCP
jgi:LmbE family N-acetylglucosaminyl deacetylase